MNITPQPHQTYLLPGFIQQWQDVKKTTLKPSQI